MGSRVSTRENDHLTLFVERHVDRSGREKIFFVVETASVILQVASFKLTGKRLFRMAPIHHHFELKGWAEPKVIVRFWIISLLLVLAGLATLKLR